MRRLLLMSVVLLLTLFLVGCQNDTTVEYNFKARRNSYYIDSTKQVLITYETDNNGKMIDLAINRLLTVEELLLMDPSIDYDMIVEGFDGDIFVEPSNTCTTVSNTLLVPINLEVGNTRYKYNENACQYQIVDSYNQYKSGYDEEYYLSDTIAVSPTTPISIIIYDEDAVVRFVEVKTLYNSVKDLGLHTLRYNEDNNAYLNTPYHYYHDIKIYEQLYLKYQLNETTIDEISGYSTDINILDIGSLDEVNPLITNFSERFSLEINAMNELEAEIGENLQSDEEESE
ncbi:MAG: hypothetical protein UMR38_02500 [Candidatus Izemoplasma sp.]|nr:hypothetical protein [Candidatus Izemoplasma sp.]